jgi:hypothetical protein
MFVKKCRFGVLQVNDKNVALALKGLTQPFSNISVISWRSVLLVEEIAGH